MRGSSLWGPYNKDPTIEGTILRSPFETKTPKSFSRKPRNPKTEVPKSWAAVGRGKSRLPKFKAS